MGKLAVVETGASEARPKFVTALGKQKAGKTMFLRWLVERGANNRTRELRLIDADPHNDTLRQHYPGAMSPESSAIEDRRISLEEAIREQSGAAMCGKPYDTLVDVGGGDLLMSRLARDVQFTDVIERIGLDLIAFYMLSPSLSDLEYFQALDDAGFSPKRLALVFNAGLIQGDRRPERAFDAVLDSPLVTKLVERGAVLLFMPALAADCVEVVEKSGAKTFREAIPKVGMWHETRLATWLDQKMEAEVAKPLSDLGWLV